MLQPPRQELCVGFFLVERLLVEEATPNEVTGHTVSARHSAGGFRFSLDAMWSEVSKLNMMKLVPALQMPVFFFVAR